MKRILLWKQFFASVFLLFIGSGLYSQVVRQQNVAIQPEDSPPSKNWVGYFRSGAETFNFIPGPANAPLGCGSVVIKTNGPADKATLFNFDHIGTKLSDIKKMSFSTYRFNGTDQQVASLNLTIDFNGAASGGFATLVWEPVYNTDQGPVVSGQWQSWDAYNGGNGIWWSTRPLGGGICATSCYTRWQDIVDNNPNAYILGGIGFNQGSGAQAMSTAIDAFAFDNSLYDFEPGQLQLSTTINGVTTQSNLDGSPANASFSVCNSPNNIVFGPFTDMGASYPSNRVYQVVSTDNVTVPFCNNCSAAPSAFNGATGTAALIDPTQPGTLTMTFTEFTDQGSQDGQIQESECVSGPITYTITVTPQNVYYADTDNDGFGDPNNTTHDCSPTPPQGYVSNSSDCDDTKWTWADGDGDGYGAGPRTPCGVGNNTDCDDGDPTVHSPQTYYRDADGDGFGNPGNSTTVCKSTPPPGYVSNNQDCDDTKFLYADNDNDGYGAGPKKACGVADNTDCNDNDATVHLPQTYYADRDGDGYGDATSTTTVCSSTPPAGYVKNNYDCDDNDKPKKNDDTKVLMCHNGKPECVNAKDVTKKQNEGWTLGPCIQTSCGTDDTLMCHNGQAECVKKKDYAKKLNEGWTLGPCTSPCAADETLMCHNGKTECVKNKDMNKKLSEGWTLGYCSTPGTTIATRISIPDLYRISNYPNPFSGSTTIKYELPFDSKVTIKVYDMMGRVISTLVDEQKAAGTHTVEYKGGGISRGSLYYRITATSGEHLYEQTNKMTQLQ